MERHINAIEERYRLLIDTEDFVTISTPDRLRKFVNRSYCRFFETTEAELIGTSFIDSFTDEKKHFYLKFISNMSPENPSISTTQHTGLPGKEKWIHWKETGIFDENGNLIEVLSVGRDVDEIVRIRKDKETLLKMLGVYRQAIDLNILSSITDAKGIIIYANKKFCEVSKYSSRELLGHSHNIINSGYHSKKFFAHLWKTILAGKMWHGEIKNKAKDGTFYWVDTVIMPIKDSTNNVTGFLSLRMQIDEKKKIEEDRNAYVKSLEDMLFMLSHEIRKPVATSLGIVNIMQEGIPEKEEYDKMLAYLLDLGTEMDNYVHKMNDYIEKNIRSAVSRHHEE